MENSEEVFQILERFSKLKQKDIPKELDDYLCFVAKTGDTVYRWPMIKHLFREKLMQVIKDFYESTPSIADLPQDPNVDPFNYESMKNALLERLELFNAAPFTVQRICELLTDPRKQYSRIDKFMRAIEKNILVVSTTEPGRKRGESETAESVDSVINGDLSSESVDSDENDITFADLTAKLTNDNKVEDNATETKENGSADKPDVDMKESLNAAVVEPETIAQPPAPSLAEDKKPAPAEKPEEPKSVEPKEPVMPAVTPETTVVVPNDKPTEMEEDKPVIKNDKPEVTPATDEAMPIEENKTEESSNIIVPNITITSIPEENGVVAVEASKVTENGDTDVELKLTEEIISVTSKSPSKPVSDITSKTEPIVKKDELEKVEEKREPEDLLDEPEPKKLRTESNYSTIPVVEITPSIPQKEEEEMTVEPSKESEITEKLEEKSVPTEKPKQVALVEVDEPMKTEKVVEEKEILEKPEVANAPLKEIESKEENPPEIAQKENGKVTPDSITEVETIAPIVEDVVDKTESADVDTVGKVEDIQIMEPVVESKPIEEDKQSEPAVETPLEDATAASVVEVPVVVAVIEEPEAVVVVAEEPLVTEAVVAPVVVEQKIAPVVVVEEPIVSVIPVVESSVLPIVVPVEEEKPVILIPEITSTSIGVEPVPKSAAVLTIIDAPVPADESINIPAPLSPMQSSETTQEMDTNSNENKMDADDVVDGNNATEAATMINKAAADDNAMEVDDSVEPMDQ